MGVTQYEFDPSYGYTLDALLDVSAPKAPKDFDAFWMKRYQNALAVDAQPQTTVVSENQNGWRVLEITYTSTDNFIIRGWLLLPVTGIIKRGIIVRKGIIDMLRSSDDDINLLTSLTLLHLFIRVGVSPTLLWLTNKFSGRLSRPTQGPM